MNFVKFLRTPFLQNKSGRLFLNIVNSNLPLAENLQLEDIRIFIFDIYAKTGTEVFYRKGVRYIKRRLY